MFTVRLQWDKLKVLVLLKPAYKAEIDVINKANVAMAHQYMLQKSNVKQKKF
jgi:hypothetical protein